MRTPTPYHHSTPTQISVVPVSKPKSLNSSGDIILFFMDMLTTVKLYHWKTMNYATHKATDELYDDLNKYVDEFVEVLLGYKGGVRAKLPRTQVTLHDCNSIEEFKKKSEEFLASKKDETAAMLQKAQQARAMMEARRKQQEE